MTPRETREMLPAAAAPLASAGGSDLSAAPSTASPELSRRQFCRWAALSLVTAGLGGAGCAAAPRYRGAVSRGRLRVPRGEFSESDPVEVLIVDAPELPDPILLIRRDEEYSALSAVCTHEGCYVEPSGEELACPCDGSTYDLDGNVRRGPADRMLDPFPVEVTESGVEIITSEMIRGTR